MKHVFLSVLLTLLTSSHLLAQAPTPWVPRGTMLDRPAHNSTFQGKPGLPGPLEGHAYTLTEINKSQRSLLGKVVKITIDATSADEVPGSHGAVKVFASDAKADGTSSLNYSFVEFPAEGAAKMRVMEKTGPLSFYVRVDPDELRAVGRSRNIDSFSRTFIYTW